MTREEKERRFVDAVQSRQGMLYRVALSLLRSPQDAEDAVCEGVDSAWRSLEKIRNMEALDAYLIRCTINAAHTLGRRRKREVCVQDMELVLGVEEKPSALWEYLIGLPEKYCLPIMLRYSEQMTLSQVCATLRIPRSTAAHRIDAGLRLLREQLVKEENRREVE